MSSSSWPSAAWDLLLGLAVGLLAVWLIDWWLADPTPALVDPLNHQVDYGKWDVILQAEAIVREAAGDAAG